MQAVIDKIMEAKSVAVLTHLNEDPDTIGSCFAFAKVMRKLGKEATVYVNGRIESRLAFIGDDYVLYQEGMKHNHDLCACIDCGDLGRIAERKSLFEEINNSINIDHHLTNTNFADANYVDGKAAAAGEILYALFERKLSLKPLFVRFMQTAISVPSILLGISRNMQTVKLKR